MLLSKLQKETRYHSNMSNEDIKAIRSDISARILKVKRQLTKLRREREDLEVLIIDEEYDLQTLQDELKKTSKE